MNDFQEIKTQVNHTPLINLGKDYPRIHLKVEYQNPVGAMKFRAIPPLVRQMFENKEVKHGQSLVIRSAGSAAVAMAWQAVQLGINPIAVLPKNAPRAIVDMLKWLGADVRMVGPDEATTMMKELSESDCSVIFAQANEPRLIPFYRPVAREIVEQCPGVRAITVGMGTGLSAMGIAKEILEIKPEVHVFGVEPAESPVASQGKWGPHKIPGLAPPIAQPLLDTILLSDIILVESDLAWQRAQVMARRKGWMLGPSSGATLQAAMRLREQGFDGEVVAVAACGIAEYI